MIRFHGRPISLQKFADLQIYLPGLGFISLGMNPTRTVSLPPNVLIPKIQFFFCHWGPSVLVSHKHDPEEWFRYHSKDTVEERELARKVGCCLECECTWFHGFLLWLQTFPGKADSLGTMRQPQGEGMPIVEEFPTSPPSTLVTQNKHKLECRVLEK